MCRVFFYAQNRSLIQWSHGGVLCTCLQTCLMVSHDCHMVITTLLIDPTKNAASGSDEKLRIFQLASAAPRRTRSEQPHRFPCNQLVWPPLAALGLNAALYVGLWAISENNGTVNTQQIIYQIPWCKPTGKCLTVHVYNTILVASGRRLMGVTRRHYLSWHRASLTPWTELSAAPQLKSSQESSFLSLWAAL